jgi:hypothetical protein
MKLIIGQTNVYDFAVKKKILDHFEVYGVSSSSPVESLKACL